MSPILREHSLAEHYDQNLRLAHDKRLPAGYPKPAPTCAWPKGNIELYERYRDFLISGGTSEGPTKIIYLPVAGHVLGLNLKPHSQIDLEDDLERVMEYARAKQSSPDWIKANRNGLEKFRRFLRIERGLGEPIKTTPFDIARHTAGLPAWLVSELERQQHLQQRNWRPARLDMSIHSFWGHNLHLWRFLVEQRGVQQLADVKRQHIFDYIDLRLAAGRAVSGVNGELQYFRSFLLFLQDEGVPVPQSLLRIPNLKPPDALPKYLTDEQVQKLRDEIERGVRESARPRDALLERAVFYLLWQGGLRLGEVEDLRLEDLDFPAKKLSVRNGKGLKDRAVYLSQTVIAALNAYLPARGMGSDDHVFLYRNVALKKDLIHTRLKSAGERAGVHVYPHRLRHTCATQLLNAGCRITSIQAFLGHKKLNTTMIYARAHDQTVADDYFNAMQRVEQRLDVAPAPQETAPSETSNPGIVQAPERAEMLLWVEKLAQPELCLSERLEVMTLLRQLLILEQDHPPPESKLNVLLKRCQLAYAISVDPLHEVRHMGNPLSILFL